MENGLVYFDREVLLMEQIKDFHHSDVPKWFVAIDQCSQYSLVEPAKGPNGMVISSSRAKFGLVDWILWFVVANEPGFSNHILLSLMQWVTWWRKVFFISFCASTNYERVQIQGALIFKVWFHSCSSWEGIVGAMGSAASAREEGSVGMMSTDGTWALIDSKQGNDSGKMSIGLVAPKSTSSLQSWNTKSRKSVAKQTPSFLGRKRFESWI